MADINGAAAELERKKDYDSVHVTVLATMYYYSLQRMLIGQRINSPSIRLIVPELVFPNVRVDLVGPLFYTLGCAVWEG